MALESHLIPVRRLKKYIVDVIGKKANLPATSKTVIGNITQIFSDLTDLSSVTKKSVPRSNYFGAGVIYLTKCNKQIQIGLSLATNTELIADNSYRVSDTGFPKGDISVTSETLNSNVQFTLALDSNGYLMIQPKSGNIPADAWLVTQINYIAES